MSLPWLVCILWVNLGRKIIPWGNKFTRLFIRYHMLHSWLLSNTKFLMSLHSHMPWAWRGEDRSCGSITGCAAGVDKRDFFTTMGQSRNPRIAHGSTWQTLIKKTGLKGSHLKHMHINKKVPSGEHHGESSHFSSGESAWLAAPLKHTNSLH